MHKNFIHPNCLPAAKGDCGRVRRGRSPLAHFDIRSRSGNRYIYDRHKHSPSRKPSESIQGAHAGIRNIHCRQKLNGAQNVLKIAFDNVTGIYGQ